MKKVNSLLYIYLLGMLASGLYAVQDKFAQYRGMIWEPKISGYKYVTRKAEVSAAQANKVNQEPEYSSHWMDDGITRTQHTVTDENGKKVVVTETWTTENPNSYVTVKNAAIGAAATGAVLGAGYGAYKGYQYLNTPEVKNEESPEDVLKNQGLQEESEASVKSMVASEVEAASENQSQAVEQEQVVAQDQEAPVEAVAADQSEAAPVAQPRTWRQWAYNTFIDNGVQPDEEHEQWRRAEDARDRADDAWRDARNDANKADRRAAAMKQVEFIKQKRNPDNFQVALIPDKGVRDIAVDKSVRDLNRDSVREGRGAISEISNDSVRDGRNVPRLESIEAATKVENPYSGSSDLGAAQPQSQASTGGTGWVSSVRNVASQLGQKATATTNSFIDKTRMGQSDDPEQSSPKGRKLVDVAPEYASKAGSAIYKAAGDAYTAASDMYNNFEFGGNIYDGFH